MNTKEKFVNTFLIAIAMVLAIFMIWFVLYNADKRPTMYDLPPQIEWKDYPDYGERLT